MTVMKAKSPTKPKEATARPTLKLFQLFPLNCSTVEIEKKIFFVKRF